MKMHANEIEMNPTLICTLIATQFPHWAHLFVTPQESAGSSNMLCRLGDGMVIRMPRIPKAAAEIKKEQMLLPTLAPRLRLPIPTVIAHGAPDASFPWAWSVFVIQARQAFCSD